MEIIRTSGVASYVVVPLIDAASRPSYKASPTLAAGDVKVIRHTGGAWDYSNIGTLPAIIGGSATKQILVTLTATELTSDNLNYPIIIQFVDQTATKEWDDQEIIVWTKPQVANLTQIDGETTQYNNATLNLKQLNIHNDTNLGGASSDAAIYAESDYGDGAYFLGAGANSGIRARGGNSAGAGLYCDSVVGGGNGAVFVGRTTYAGIKTSGGSTSGAGFETVGGGTSHGILSTGGSTGGAGARFVGVGASGHGVDMVAGSTTANGLKIAGGTSNGAAVEISATWGDGVKITANGSTCCGILSTGGVDGSGMRLMGGGGLARGLDILGYGDGVNIQGGYGGASGDGMNILSTKGHGLALGGGATFHDLQSDEIQAIQTQTDKMQFDGSNNIKSVKNATTAGTADFNATEKASIGTAVAGSGVTLADGSITAAKFAAGAVDANAFDQTAADKVWATTSRTITDKAGYALTSAYDPAKTAAQASALATTDGKVDLVKAKTDQLIFTGGAVDSNVASIETDALSAAAVSAAAVTKIQDGLALVADVEAVGVAVGAVDSHLSAVGANVQSVVDVLPSGGAEISKFALTDELDTVAVSEIFELVLCMVTGRFKKDYPTAGDLTFYKQDNLTVLKLMHVTETERTRI